MKEKTRIIFYLVLMSCLIISYVIAICCLSGCGGIIEDPDPPPDTETEVLEPYCGDDICDLDESYWDCPDCVDPYTGGPKNGHCGDGVCFNESMTSCWRDCRPKQHKQNTLRDLLPDVPFPIPDIPIPEPGEQHEENIMGYGHPSWVRERGYPR